MMQIGTVQRVATARATAKARDTTPRPAPRQTESSRALVAIDGGRTDAPAADATQKARGGTRPLAGFLTQIIVAADPTLRPSRLERTAAAAARYAEVARLAG